MNRIDRKFEQIKSKNKKVFIGYLTAGDPTLSKTEELVHALELGGTDIVEIGIPFSDPLADGPTIQEAARRALEQKVTVRDIMYMVRNIRKKSQIPLIYLVYINTILVYGKEKFIQECLDVGIDGLIIPDLPLEERDEIETLLIGMDIALIPIVAPTSKDRIRKVIENCKGFVYCVSSLGVTGGDTSFHKDVINFLKEVREKSEIPIAIGFGISSKKDIEEFKDYVDGIIVGSAIVREIKRTKGDREALTDFVSKLSK